MIKSYQIRSLVTPLSKSSLSNAFSRCDAAVHLRAVVLALALLPTLSCNGGSSPTSPTTPGGQSFSGVYSLHTIVDSHNCPEASAPAAGARLNKTLILDDRRPNLTATLGGQSLRGTVTATGTFSLYNALENDHVFGTVSSTEISGQMTHGVVTLIGSQLTHICDWSEGFSGTRQS